MTVTDAARESVQAGLEQTGKPRIESHLNPPPSYDLDDHPVPTGREEIWRFTPLKRLRGVLDGPPSDAHLGWETELPAGVTLTEITDEQARELGELAPNDRPAALAVANAGGAMLLDVPDEQVVEEPVVIRLTGTTVDDLVWGRLLLRFGKFSRRPSCSCTPARRSTSRPRR